MAESFEININGNLYSATSAEVVVGNDKYFGLRTITYKEETPQNPQHGQGTVAVGRTKGNYVVTASFEILKHEGDRLLVGLKYNALTLFGSDSYSDAIFSFAVRMFEAPPLGASALEMLGVKLTSAEEGIQTGGDATVLKCDLSVIRPIRRTINGEIVTMVRDPLGNSDVLGVNIL